MANYGIMHTYNVDSSEAALLRNLCEPGVEKLEEEFPTLPSDYYFDMCVQYDGGGLLGFTRVYMENRHDEGASVSISTLGSPPSGAIGDTLWLPPNTTNTGHASIPMKRISMSQRIEDGQVVWGMDGHQTSSWQTGGLTGFYNRDNANADVTIFYATVPVTFNYGDVWVFQTWLDTPLLTYTPPQSFLDSLTKESNYYITYYLGRVNGDTTASNAQRIYFKKDPGTIHVRTCSTGNNTGWYISWNNADEDDLAWNYILSNSNGASDNWSMSGGSGDWTHKMWEYDSTRDPLNGYLVLLPYWLFIIESTVPIDYGGYHVEPPTPTNGDHFFFNKDADNSFKLIFGTYCGEESNHTTASASTFAQYYQTDPYEVHVRFTSPVTGTSYIWKQFEAHKTLQRVDQSYDLSGGSINYFPKYQDHPWLMVGLRGMKRQFDWDEEDRQNTFDEVNAVTFSQLQDFRSVNELYLSELLHYFNLTDLNFTSEDLFTTIYMDFVNFDNKLVVETLSCDYSSLLGSGLNVDDGSHKDEGHSWDPLPGHEDDDTNPDLNPDPTNTIPPIVPKISPYGVFNRLYAINSDKVQEIANKLRSDNQSVFDDIIDGLALFGAKPLDAIVDLTLYPFDVLKAANLYTQMNISLGRWDSGISGYRLFDDTICIIDMGSYYVKEYYHNFLDYAPYTILRLYIPYVGTINLDPNIYMNRTVNVRLIVDYATAACVAMVYCNGIPMTYQQGMIGTKIPITGVDLSTYASTLLSNIIGAGGSSARALISGVKASPSVISDATTALNDIVKLSQSFEDIPLQLAGTSSPGCGNWLPQECHIVIGRPVPIFDGEDKVSEKTVYGKVNGYATAEAGTLASLLGAGGSYPPGVNYCSLGALSAGGSETEPVATEKEIDMIRDLLNRGFYITPFN